MANPLAVIIGVGDGLSASLARQLHAAGYRLVLAARNADKLAGLAKATGAATRSMDAADPAAMAALFAGLDACPRVAIYNPSARVRGPVAELDPEEVRRAVEITAFGAFLMGREAAKLMLEAPVEDGRRGTILFTGASAGVKGFPQSAVFAMGKFAQRGLAESMARELHPKGIHVAWINIDGGIRNPGRTEPADAPDSMLDPEAIAAAYLQLVAQDRSAWSNEITLRPWVERF
ncbi:MAG: oxidoreductase [Alphaproteobacteria bacterium HGW-Alphaproteobacteria-2]|nr:MAG: oxidoreductase [Alphaproteobacteria bacterium HGW-Alphaproteobacteria-2]